MPKEHNFFVGAGVQILLQLGNTGEGLSNTMADQGGKRMKLTNLTHHHLWRTRVATFMALALLAALAPRTEATSTDLGEIKGAVVATGIKAETQRWVGIKSL